MRKDIAELINRWSQEFRFGGQRADFSSTNYATLASMGHAILPQLLPAFYASRIPEGGLGMLAYSLTQRLPPREQRFAPSERAHGNFALFDEEAAQWITKTYSPQRSASLDERCA